MSTFVIPASWPQCARHLVGMLGEHLDAQGIVPAEGEPPSCITTMMRLTASSRSTVYRALMFLGGVGLVELDYQRRFLKVRVRIELLERERGFCDECGTPTEAGRWCPMHKQSVGRHDRRWQIAAQELLRCGVEPVRIASLLQRPAFSARAPDGREAAGGAVVPYLLGKGLLGEEWGERLRAATRGAGMGDDG